MITLNVIDIKDVHREGKGSGQMRTGECE